MLNRREDSDGNAVPAASKSWSAYVKTNDDELTT